MQQDAKDLVTRTFEDFFNGRNAALAPELFALEFVENAKEPFGGDAPGLVRGPEHMVGVLDWLVRQFPDIHSEVCAIITEGDLVSVRVRNVGTNLGPLGGAIPPTGRRFDNEVTHWYRVAHNRIAEHWATRDDLTAMLQLGVITRPGPSRAR